jgi:hypothetical protein
MANLLNQNIGTNYKGILNLNTLNGNLSGTLQAVTDGDGNASPLQLSTTSVSFGGSTGLNWDNANTRLGIGTNTPLGILHLKTAAGTTRLLLDGDAGQSKIITYRTAGLQRFGLYTNNTAESGANAGSDFAIRAYSDTGTLLSTPIFIKRSTGFVGIGTTTTSARLHVLGNGTNPIALFEGSGTIGNLVCFGGTTNAFPALKNNGTSLEVRLANDTNFAPITAGDDSKFRGLFRFQDTSGNSRGLVYPDGYLTSGSHFFWNGTIGVGVLGVNISAILQLESTTRGFLPPRMTETQRNAIATPAAGLIVYNTTTNLMNFYNGTIWAAF